MFSPRTAKTADTKFSGICGSLLNRSYKGKIEIYFRLNDMNRAFTTLISYLLLRILSEIIFSLYSKSVIGRFRVVE